jgi:glutaconyl-CoA/methylmalonyl-CoA decarboxylase subunit gamma
MRFKAEIDGVEHRIAASADGALAVGSDSYRAVVTKVSANKRLVKVGEKTIEVRLVETDSTPAEGKYLFEMAGELVAVNVSDVVIGGAEAVASTDAGRGRKKVAKPQLDSASGGIVAPMPGKIVDVLVKPGDKVAAGDVVVLLEAMKMENELCAINKGVVKAVLVEKGDAAQGGQLLVTLE